LDILVNFRTTYLDPKSGVEVVKWKIIAKKYVLGINFWIDLFSTIPFDDILKALIKRKLK
jgi:hypothetical protein